MQLSDREDNRAIFAPYKVIFCDIWGVLHNGIELFAKALNVLKAWQEQGKIVILVTNSPRLWPDVARQLSSLGLQSSYYQAIITSGDACQYLLANCPANIYYIGAHHEQKGHLLAHHKLVSKEQAEAVICSSLMPQLGQDIKAHEALLQYFAERNLPFICLNPDIMVDYGGQKLWCAGALAELYQQKGGKILLAGKPHRLIYELAMAKAQEFIAQKTPNAASQELVTKKQILAIGDGLLTDIKGARDFAIDSVFIAGGIHRDSFKDLKQLFASYDIYPSFIMSQLA